MKPEENTNSFLPNANTTRGDTEVRLIIPPRILIRPKKYTEVGQMESTINSYFEDMDAQQRPYTIEGLSLACGFSSTNTLRNYERLEGYEPFHELVKMAKLKILQQRIEYGLTKKTHPILTIWLVSNNFKDDYQQYPVVSEDSKKLITSFLVEMTKEEKDNGRENNSEPDSPTA